MAQDTKQVKLYPRQRVDIKAILRNPRMRMELLKGAGKGIIGRDNTVPMTEQENLDALNGK